MSDDSLSLEIYAVNGRRVWHHFAKHHYLSHSYHGHHGFIAVTGDGTPVAFTSSMVLPHAKIKHAYREHRTVVLPDFQGLGIGPRLAEWLGQWHKARGERFYSRTSHPRLAAYRDASPVWRPTSKGYKSAVGKTSSMPSYQASVHRYTYGHEYIG